MRDVNVNSSCILLNKDMWKWESNLQSVATRTWQLAVGEHESAGDLEGDTVTSCQTSLLVVKLNSGLSLLN